MEYLAGEDLEGLLRRLGPLPPALALRIIGQACMGVQHAHEAGVVHRDILELVAPAPRRRDVVENAPPASAVVHSGIAPQNRKKKVTIARPSPAPTATADAAPPAPTVTADAAAPPREITVPTITDIREPFP